MLMEKKIDAVVGILKKIEKEYAPAALASSFSIEDMLLTDIIVKHTPNIGIFTLDTGRLPSETYTLMQQTHDRYGPVVEVYSPNCTAIATFIVRNGPNAFYNSVEQRQACCAIRKLEPLNRALTNRTAWLTGLRKAQSITRSDIQQMEWDEAHNIPKFNPLLDWSEQEVWAYIHRFSIPYNILYEQDFPSIGCAPCTKAVAPGEDIRAGRWWWENPQTKECGLHTNS
jgi:phosphoadenosine phosphosulfate reductase